jgi:sporulation integral membrane protein YlbJ
MKSKFAKKIKYVIFALLLLFFAAAIIVYPERYVPACLEGIILWAECVLPSLFPFMVVIMLLINTQIAERAAKPFGKCAEKIKLPQIAAPLFLMSICSGYPAGSRMVAEFFERGSITKTDAKKLSILCSSSGPLFIVGSVGYKFFGDKSAGYKILFAHILSILVVGIIYSLFAKQDSCKAKPMLKRKTNALYDSFYSAVVSVIVAGGFICFFYTFARVAQDFYLLRPLEMLLSYPLGNDCAGAVTAGLIEVTGGTLKLAACRSFLSIPLAGFLITFGGACILAQQLCYLTKCGVKPAFFISFKCLQAVVCFLILLLIAT